MTHLLDPKDYDNAREVLSELSAYNAAISALLDGINDGWVLVDDSQNPRCALAMTVEGHHLAGDPTNDAFVAGVNAYLKAHYFHDEPRVEGGGVHLCIDPDGWVDKLPALMHPREPLTAARRHYVCTGLQYTSWRDDVPAGFAVRQIDDVLLDDSTLDIPDHIHGWIAWNWKSRERYRAHGFGMCVVDEAEKRVVSWSLADCAAKDGHCEIGIQTLPAYRRRGLAAITAAANVEYALAHGFVKVGWQCDDNNTGSYKTAEKVGFVHDRNYTHYYCMFGSLHHRAESGWHWLQQGQPARAVESFGSVLALGDDYPHHVYHGAAQAYAACGDTARAFALLHKALDRGWTHFEHTKTCTEFATLRGLPEWETILARTENGHPN